MTLYFYVEAYGGPFDDIDIVYSEVFKTEKEAIEFMQDRIKQILYDCPEDGWKLDEGGEDEQLFAHLIDDEKYEYALEIKVHEI